MRAGISMCQTGKHATTHTSLPYMQAKMSSKACHRRWSSPQKMIRPREEGKAYGRKLMDAGFPVAINRYNGMIHDFVLHDAIRDLPEVETALRQASDGIQYSVDTEEWRTCLVEVRADAGAATDTVCRPFLEVQDLASTSDA